MIQIGNWPLPHGLPEKSFPRRKTVLWMNPISKTLRSTIFPFSLSFTFLLTIFFCYLFLDPPPGVCLNKKSPSHFCTQSTPEHRFLKAYLFQTRPAVLQENALTRPAPVSPRPGKNQPIRQPSLAHNPQQSHQPRNFPRLSPNPAE